MILKRMWNITFTEGIIFLFCINEACPQTPICLIISLEEKKMRCWYEAFRIFKSEFGKQMKLVCCTSRFIRKVGFALRLASHISWGQPLTSTCDTPTSEESFHSYSCIVNVSTDTYSESQGQREPIRLWAKRGLKSTLACESTLIIQTHISMLHSFNFNQSFICAISIIHHLNPLLSPLLLLFSYQPCD